jgi:AbrB family looped-hinge helix DNA binding protein
MIGIIAGSILAGALRLLFTSPAFRKFLWGHLLAPLSAWLLISFSKAGCFSLAAANSSSQMNRSCMPGLMVYAIINGMTIHVDGAGRIVLPKPIRERLRIHSGCELSLEESAEGILLRPVTKRPSLIIKRGLLLHTGAAAKSYDWNRMVEDQREEHIQDVSGL